ncbi:MAG TPA: long-chain fatty acid--CoA ligase [Spirochaetota bacterium]|nr:long-chain fatty acid--CoA ligase [Spirochaetota bacterium]HPI91320.1 long-chain fatty acid--CoA ligase [Spirochaetota bacterium]HPR50053.1 long-chain fatty acid--CoA ligase [Spirochaetota bacterium]
MFEEYQLDKPDNLVEFLEKSVAEHGDRPYLEIKKKAGGYEWVTYREVGKRVDNLRGGLAGLGISQGDGVGIISNNSIDWAVSHYATLGLGGFYVPMYEAELPSTWEYIVRDSGMKILFVSKKEIYDRVKDFQSRIPELQKIIIIEGQGNDTMSELEALGVKNQVKSIHPKAEDVAVLVYTSGTTGDPKGVLLTHGNWTSNHHARAKAYPYFNPDDRTLSLLPWAHCFGLGELHTMTAVAGSLGFMESVSTIVDDMSRVRPTFLVAVPRVFNKVYDTLVTRINNTGGLKKMLFDAGVKAAKERRLLTEQGKKSFKTDIKFKIIDRIVFKKIRDLFGGRLKLTLTGSATMNPEISRFFFDIGIPLYDAYGLSETTPGISSNVPDCYRFGSVGKVIDKVRVVIDKSAVEPDADDGEIVCYGPNVMKGYHNKPEETAKVMTHDGGLRTGDRGRFDRDGFLWITGRIKEQYKLENGKYVFPAALEEDICLNHYVQNALVFGAGREYNVCLIVPESGALIEYARKKDLPMDFKVLAAQQDIQNMITGEIVEALKKKFASYEIPRKFFFLNEQFTLENGMMTQTMKIKRKVVLQKYHAQIDELYKN